MTPLEAALTLGMKAGKRIWFIKVPSCSSKLFPCPSEYKEMINNSSKQFVQIQLNQIKFSVVTNLQILQALELYRHQNQVWPLSCDQLIPFVPRFPEANGRLSLLQFPLLRGHFKMSEIWKTKLAKVSPRLYQNGLVKAHIKRITGDNISKNNYRFLK